MLIDDSFAPIPEGLRQRDPEAAARLVARFAGRLVGLARRRLGNRLQSKFGPADVVQSVF